MTLPGERLRAIARRVCGPHTMERLIDPIVADIRREHAGARRDGRLWRSRWIHVVGVWALIKSASLHAATSWPLGRAAVAAAATTSIVMAPLVLAPLMDSASLGRFRAVGNPSAASTAELAIYLLPQALAVALPVGFAAAVLAGLWKGVTTLRSRRVILATALACSVATLLNVGWISPAANQKYRTLVVGGSIEPGANELTFNELRRRATEGVMRPVSIADPLPLPFWYHARLAMSAAPIALACFSLAVAGMRRRRLRWIHAASTLGIYLGCYVFFPAEQAALLFRWLPPNAVAWLPNVVVLIAAFSAVPFRDQASA